MSVPLTTSQWVIKIKFSGTLTSLFNPINCNNNHQKVDAVNTTGTGIITVTVTVTVNEKCTDEQWLYAECFIDFKTLEIEYATNQLDVPNIIDDNRRVQ